MNKNKLITPEGTKDFLFEEALLRKDIENNLRKTFMGRGYHEVITPSLEFLDVFTTKDNAIPVEQMFKVVDTKGRIMVMRPDSTTPIARLCATRLKKEKLPLRLYYNQSVFSVNNSLKGHSNETVQTGIELIGVSNTKSDIEVLVTAIKTVQSLNIDNFVIEIGHIGIFNSLIKALGVSDILKSEITNLIKSKNYPTLNDVLDEIGQTEEVNTLKSLPRLFGGKEVFQKAKDLIKDKETLENLNYLENLFDLLSTLGLDDKISVDLGIVNMTDYYTGIVFKGYIEGYGEEVLSGGRYDTLIKEFGEDMGAVGFAVNVDSVANSFMAKGKSIGSKIDILVFAEEDSQIKALEYVDKLVHYGYSTEYSLYDNRNDAIDYAKEKGIAKVCVVGDEIKEIIL